MRLTVALRRQAKARPRLAHLAPRTPDALKRLPHQRRVGVVLALKVAHVWTHGRQTHSHDRRYGTGTAIASPRLVSVVSFLPRDPRDVQSHLSLSSGVTEPRLSLVAADADSSEASPATFRDLA